MQIAIDLSTRTVMTWTGVVISSLAMTCRDRFFVDVRFISNGKFVELPDGAQGKLSIKAPKAWSGQALAYSLNWEKTIKPVVYRFFLRLDTVELVELFAAEPDSVGLEMELEWAYNLGETPIRQTSKPILVVISNDYIRETDGLPVLAIDLKATEEDSIIGLSNDRWMTPLRTRESVEQGALSSVGFSESATPPAAPASGRKLFLSASGEFFSIDSAGQVAPVVNDNLLPVIFSIAPPDNPAPTQRWINKNDLRAYEFLDGVWVQTCGAN